MALNEFSLISYKLLEEHFWGPFYYHGLTDIGACIINPIHCFMWDIITYQLKLGYGLVITYMFCMDVITNACPIPDVGLLNFCQ